MMTALLVLGSIVLVILLTSKFKLNAFFTLIFVALGLIVSTLNGMAGAQSAPPPAPARGGRFAGATGKAR